MDYAGRWLKLRKLGSGGQGAVYLVVDKKKLPSDVLEIASRALGPMRSAIYRDDDAVLDLIRALTPIVGPESSGNYGALKELLHPEMARDADRAATRLMREIESLRKAKHPSLARVLDSDPDGQWIVTAYYNRGSLEKHLPEFKGNVLGLSRARCVLSVDGVAQLHAMGVTHRDIKPNNIFVAEDGHLVLGDFGLVHDTGQDGDRLSATNENVGSLDWMPLWAQSIRTEVAPDFDVFGLGKVLWAMVLGKSLVRFHYWDSEDYLDQNVTQALSDVPFGHTVRRILSKTVTEHKKDCLPDSGELLALVEECLKIAERGVAFQVTDKARRCAVCGIGTYKMMVNRNPAAEHNFGFGQMGTLRVLKCSHCGHAQIFHIGTGDAEPPAWQDGIQ